jgi:E3 ubiquitin-protein ligase MARCH6
VVVTVVANGGALDFIRDPDDATFHPVRDVLERSVSTQLRKIAFSALVYGALVIVCLGGVVWGLYYTFDGILPIHWSSNEPVLEFPVDLLFYNFLMPVVIRFFKPSDGLHMMYSWWFRVCGRMLRLSWFLFGERQEDEEGHHVRRTWWDLLLGKKGDVHQPVIGEDRRVLAEDRNVDAYFLRDGKYVRAPASDQVRIPKGGKVFLEVNEDNERVDGQPDREDGLHGRNTELFAKVYVPPWFRVRISLFILFIWIFAAVTGVSITVVPLVFGRMIFSTIIPNHLRMNDVYAFSIGIYILGGLIYGALWFQNAIASVKKTVTSDHQSLNQALRRATKFSTRVARLLYTYAAFAFLLPSLFALLMEFYVIIPIHTYFTADEEHVIHFIQDWTLGVLYVKMAGRLILWYSQSRPAEALRAIVRKGWFDPNARIATRCFIMPATVIMGGALLVPIPLGYVVNTLCFSRASAATHSQVYRYSYPAVLVIIMVICLVYLMGVMLKGWRQKIRDEVYLIGERLHNFGERRPPAPSPVVVT